MPDEKTEKHPCSICGKETTQYCHSCARTWGEFNPTYYCDKHMESVVETGNCCRGSEILYSVGNC